MANVDLSAQVLSRVGLDATDNGSLSTSDTYFVPNDGHTFLHFKKSGASTCTVTITTTGSVDGLAIADLTVSVPASTGDVMVGPFPRETYNDPATGKLSFTCSNITGLTVAAVSVGA